MLLIKRPQCICVRSHQGFHLQKMERCCACSTDKVTTMNALPVKNSTPQEIIDDLVADVGIIKVIFATIARVFKRSRPPDSLTFPGLAKQPGIDVLNNHLRADVGLPPKDAGQIRVDPILMSLNRF